MWPGLEELWKKMLPHCKMWATNVVPGALHHQRVKNGPAASLSLSKSHTKYIYCLKLMSSHSQKGNLVSSAKHKATTPAYYANRWGKNEAKREKAKLCLIIFRNNWLLLGKVESNLDTRLEMWVKDLLWMSVGHDVEYGFIPNSIGRHWTVLIRKATDLTVM